MKDDVCSPRLYGSKVTTFFDCPKKFYWKYCCGLDTASRPDYFAFGSDYHNAVEQMILRGQDHADLTIEQCTQPNDKKDLLRRMVDEFATEWRRTEVRRVVGTEQSVGMDIAGIVEAPYFNKWYVKADVVFTDDQGMWVGDHKTTAGYGPATAKHYHDSLQTKSYFYVLQSKMPAIRGTKIFVCTKAKQPKCVTETILLSDKDRYQAELYITETTRQITRCMEEKAYGGSDAFPRSMTSCVNSYGHECPYLPICINPIKSTTWLSEVLDEWYIITDPDAHLGLKPGE